METMGLLLITMVVVVVRVIIIITGRIDQQVKVIISRSVRRCWGLEVIIKGRITKGRFSNSRRRLRIMKKVCRLRRK